MGLAVFYHLTRSGAAETAINLLTRAHRQGWRVMVRGTDPEVLRGLDASLWLGPEGSFLPHGLQGGAHDADQPILLGTGPATNAAEAVMLLDGADTDEAEVAAAQRVWVIFDGAQDRSLAAARALWTRLTGAGHAAQYWSEDSGRWELKAEKG